MLQFESAALKFDSADEELRFLRGLVAVQRLADEVLEDCIARQLGLAAAADVFLTQCARMVHASAAFLQLEGVEGPVLTRTWGDDWSDLSDAPEGVAAGNGATTFVVPLDLGHVKLGKLGFRLHGHFSDGGAQVMALVRAVAEMFDSAVLSFIALADGRPVQARLSELGEVLKPRPHAHIGRYEVLEPLGTGGMAQVMVARTLNPQGISRLVAVKRILPKLAAEPALVHQFLDEAKLGMRLSHPNLAVTYDFGEADGTYFIALELVRGIDFDHLIYWPHGAPSLEVVSAVVSQALEGLQAAHDVRGDDGLPLGLVHRDVSPHNLMVGFDGLVKVLDFGVAKMRHQRTVTLPGLVKGKPLYMSPEQAAAERIDRRSDIFSMGLVLHEALTRTRAFDKQNDTLSMQAIVNEPLVRHPAIPDAVWPVVARALEKSPLHRFQSAADMAQALRLACPPMPSSELGNLVAARFPRRVAEVAAWEAMRLERGAAERRPPTRVG
ncbi:MAG: serine/threonine protein kinase [Archangium sp.]|nr:serine/threonine protein kinase [Archangium sp.]